MCDDKLLNPYLPPSPQERAPRCMSLIGRLVLALPFIRTLRFEEHDVELCRPFAFWLDRAHSLILFAPCPFETLVDENQRQVIVDSFHSESSRFATRSRLSLAMLVDRILVVRWIDHEMKVQLRIAREAWINWAVVEHSTRKVG